MHCANVLASRVQEMSNSGAKVGGGVLIRGQGTLFRDRRETTTML